MSNNWHGAGELWKNEVEDRLADPQKRKDFYGDKAVRQVGKKLLGTEYKKEESADQVVAKLKERQDITKDTDILAKKLAPEKVAKGRLLSAILSDFFTKECGSKQANADALIALKYLNAELDNVDWLEAGETVSIENGMLTIKKGNEVVAQGALLDRAKLPPNSPAAVSRRGTIKKKSKEARGKITMAPGQIPGGVSAPPENDDVARKAQWEAIKASLPANEQGTLDALTASRLERFITIEGQNMYYLSPDPQSPGGEKVLANRIKVKLLPQNIMHLEITINHKGHTLTQDVGIDFDEPHEAKTRYIYDAINDKIHELQQLGDQLETIEKFQNSPLRGRLIDISGHNIEYFYPPNRAQYRVKFHQDGRADIEVLYIRPSDGKQFRDEVRLDIKNPDDFIPEKVDAKILERLQKFEDYVDPKKTERMQKRAANRRRRSGHGG